jgi:Methyltransferase domain
VPSGRTPPEFESRTGVRFGNEVDPFVAFSRLPFPEASFDLVTCQTVLIHMPDPGAAVDEMVRVARPGGLIVAAEPNNVARALMFDSISFYDPVDEILARARLQLICERGKAALGEGNNSIGDIVPSSSPNGILLTSASISTTRRTSSCHPTTAPRNAPRSKSAQTSSIAACVPVGPTRTRVDISLPVVVVRVSSKPCGWLLLAATTKSTRQLRIGHTLDGRERVSATLSPAESQDCARLNWCDQRCP